jgi:hypothetical protein
MARNLTGKQLREKMAKALEVDVKVLENGEIDRLVDDVMLKLVETDV